MTDNRDVLLRDGFEFLRGVDGASLNRDRRASRFHRRIGDELHRPFHRTGGDASRDETHSLRQAKSDQFQLALKLAPLSQSLGRISNDRRNSNNIRWAAEIAGGDRSSLA